MALSETVNTSLMEAQAALKNALSYSARQEEPYVSVEIAKMIQVIDGVMKNEKFHERLRTEMKRHYGIDL